jgi:hypothetical protein
MTQKTSSFLAAAACAACMVVLAGDVRATLLFSEDFNDGSASTRWSVAAQTEATAEPTTMPDGSVDFAFDYSTLGIANPNGGSDTTGAFIQVNKTDQTGDEGETYIIYPNGGNFSGNFVIEADMFAYFSGSASTELGVMGLFLDNSDPVAPYEWGTRGGPLAWGYTGEGGDNHDFAVFKEGNATETGFMGLGEYPQGPFTTALGPAEGNTNGSWVDLKIVVDGTDISWSVNGTVVNTYDNSGGFYDAGNIFFGASDPFNSVNDVNGIIVDNVTVTPEPGSLLLLGLGAAGVAAVVRRRKA